MKLRPYAIIIDGELLFGLEAEVENGRLVSIQPHTGIPDDFVLSPAFVNAHSHLEYRGMQGTILETEYSAWIAEITRRKVEESDADVREACHVAARENKATGVAWIAEHSDRPFAGEAMADRHLDGILFQEVITIGEWRDPGPKLAQVREKLGQQKYHFANAFMTPHAPHTVDQESLREFGRSQDPISIHLAESRAESELFLLGTGPLMDLYHRLGAPSPKCGKSVFEFAEACGLIRPLAQIVHGCDLSPLEISRAAAAGVSVAHCPRSNRALGCPVANVRVMLDSGLRVGLGLDSAASSGPIDMFAEMRAARAEASRRADTLLGEEVWRMATTMGAASMGVMNWEESGPLIKIHLEGAQSIDEVISRGSPELVEWV